MLKFIKDHGLEGAVAKCSDSVYQPGQRTGVWSKYRVNLGQEFVVGGYVPSHLGVDSLVVGFYRGKDLIYEARVRAGLGPISSLAHRSSSNGKLPPIVNAKPHCGLMASCAAEGTWPPLFGCPAS
jgi:bifunctional non-homologous end joining protein LigD